MKKIVFVFAMLSTCAAYCWNISPEALRKKCAEKTPEWMQEQISADLSPYHRGGVNKGMIDSTWKEVLGSQGGEIAVLYRFTVKNGKITAEMPPTTSILGRTRFEVFSEALSDLNEAVGLPDLDMLVSLADHYDRPIFLRVTKAPVFTMNKSKINHNAVLIPNGLFDKDREDVFARVIAASDNLDWEDRMPIAFWRGSLSEGLYPYFDWDFKPRPKLVFFSRHNPGYVDAGFVDNAFFTQMHYSWKMWMQQNNCIRDYTAQEDQVNYRYLVAIDGSGSPWSLQWQLFSGSTLIKAESKQVEWFYAGLKPNVHYVPSREDSADLGEKIEWLRDNPEEAYKIAQNARALADERLSDEMVFLYTYKLLTAYANLQK